MNIKSFAASYPIPIVCGVLAIGFLGAAVWRASSASDVHDEVVASEAEDARLAQNIHNGQKLEANLEQIAAVNQKVLARLTNPGNVAENQQYFYKLESEAGVKIIELRQVSAPAKKGTAVSSTYSTVIYNLTVDGEYAKVLSFLRRLESGDRIVRVSNAGMALSKNTNTGYHATPPVTFTAELNFLGAL